MQKLWTPENQREMENLKEDIVVGPMLARPDPSHRSYINKDWYKYGMGVVIL